MIALDFFFENNLIKKIWEITASESEKAGPDPDPSRVRMPEAAHCMGGFRCPGQGNVRTGPGEIHTFPAGRESPEEKGDLSHNNALAINGAKSYIASII